MNKMGKIFIIIGIFLIIISISLLIYNNYEDNIAGQKSAAVLNIIKESIIENEENIINNNIVNEIETININSHDYIGTITIPSLNLELPIMSECNYKNLKIAPCRYYGSPNTFDLILCAHSYKTHFKYIGNLTKKDTVIFTDTVGKTYIYEVIKTEILNPKEVSKMIDNEFDLTLYTCTNDGLNRIVVRCNIVI